MSIGYQLRPPTMADIPALVALRNSWWQAIIGKSVTTEDQVRAEWNEPGVNPYQDYCVAVNGEQRIVGEASIYPRPPYVSYYVYAHVHPDWQMQGIGSALTLWLEDTVKARFPSAPESARIIISSSILETEKAARQLLLDHGYSLIRNFHDMDIEMVAPPPAPVFPARITIRNFLPKQDKEAAYRAHQDAFHDHYGYVAVSFEEGFPRWWHHVTEHPHYDPSTFYLAMDGEEIAGYVFAFPQDYELTDTAWIDSLGVRRPWRKQGLGLALLYYTFGELYQRGIRRVGLVVDADSLTGATRLYEKAGMKTLRRWDRYSKELRAGEDLMIK